MQKKAHFTFSLIEVLKAFFTGLFLLFLAFNLSAQSNLDTIENRSKKILFLEPGMGVFLPLGNFKKKIHRGVGFSGNVALYYQCYPDGPLFVGGDLHYDLFGKGSLVYPDSIDGLPIDIKGTVTSNMTGIDLIGRYYLIENLDIFDFYFELRIGGNILYTLFSETGTFDDNSEFYESKVLNTDFAFSYGAAGGMHIMINDNVYLTLSTIYQSSLSSEYMYKIDSDEIPEGTRPTGLFRKTSGPTPLIRIHIGVTYLFGK